MEPTLLQHLAQRIARWWHAFYYNNLERFVFFSKNAWVLFSQLPSWQGNVFRRIGNLFQWLVAKPLSILSLALGVAHLAVSLVKSLLRWCFLHPLLTLFILSTFAAGYHFTRSTEGMFRYVYESTVLDALEFLDILADEIWYLSKTYWLWIMAFLALSIGAGVLARNLKKGKQEKVPRAWTKEKTCGNDNLR